MAPLPPDDFKPLYERVATAIAAANCRSWGFCLDGFVSLQVLVYGPGDQQGWHHDVASPRAPRCFRLAASILLSRPDEFEGGQLELMLGLERRGDDSLAGPAFPRRSIPEVLGWSTPASSFTGSRRSRPADAWWSSRGWAGSSLFSGPPQGIAWRTGTSCVAIALVSVQFLAQSRLVGSLGVSS